MMDHHLASDNRNEWKMTVIMPMNVSICAPSIHEGVQQQQQKITIDGIIVEIKQKRVLKTKVKSNSENGSIEMIGTNAALR